MNKIHKLVCVVDKRTNVVVFHEDASITKLTTGFEVYDGDGTTFYESTLFKYMFTDNEDEARKLRESFSMTLTDSETPVVSRNVINHPPHYGDDSDYEVIKVFKGGKVYCEENGAWLTVEEYKGFCKGNVFKYLRRGGSKELESILKDAKKAQFYLGEYIKLLETLESKNTSETS